MERVSRPGSLLIVSNAETSGMYVEYCSWLGIPAVGVPTAADAVRQLAAARADAVVLSERLPDCSGPELARALRCSRHTFDLPIVMLASNVFAARDHDPAKQGCDLVLMVPVLPDELVDRVQDLLRHTRARRAFEAWLFLRESESVWMVRTAALELAMAGPRRQRDAVRFDNEGELQAYRAHCEQRLHRNGFALAASGADRRSGRDRRSQPRSAGERRAIS